jgi:chromosome segregation ATPase
MHKLSLKQDFELGLVALLVGVTIFSISKYARIAKEKIRLQDLLNQANTQVAGLQVQKQNLLQSLEQEKDSGRLLKAQVRASSRRLKRVNADLDKARTEATQLSAQLSSLQEENSSLKGERDALKKEMDLLDAKLSSVTELRKAMRELKKQGRRVGVQMIRAGETQDEGNRGFVIKDGKSTTAPAVKIDVLPAPQAK